MENKRATLRSVLLSKNTNASDLSNPVILEHMLNQISGRLFSKGSIRTLSVKYTQNKKDGTFFTITSVNITNISDLSKIILFNLNTGDNGSYEKITIRYRYNVYNPLFS